MTGGGLVADNRKYYYLKLKEHSLETLSEKPEQRRKIDVPECDTVHAGGFGNAHRTPGRNSRKGIRCIQEAGIDRGAG